MNKKAQSQIITTVLIILLVLAAIVIVWQVVRNTVDTGADSITSATDCIDVNLEIVSAHANDGNITVTRKAGGPNDIVSDIKVLVGGSEATITWASGAGPDLLPLETGFWTLSAFTVGDEVEVAAVLSNDAATVCDISDTEDAIA